MIAPIAHYKAAHHPSLAILDDKPLPPRLDRVWSAWISDLAEWTHAFTLTIRPCVNGVIVSRIILEQAAQHLLRRLDYRIFGRRQVERGARIPSIAVAGWGASSDRPHLHFAFSSPPGVTHDAFTKTVRSVARQLAWANREMKIEPYRDAGWANYMLGHGLDDVLVSCVRPGS